MLRRWLGRAGLPTLTVVLALASAPKAEAAFCSANGGANDCGLQVTSSASPSYPVDNVAPRLGSFDGNPGSLSSAAQILAAILGIDKGLVTGLDKSDDGPGAAGTLTATPEDGKQGSWSYTPTGSALLPTHLLVKAGNYFTVWAFDAASQGYWSTEGIVVGKGSQPELSHLTALAVTPVPAAAWLLAPALLGLAGLQRRQRKATA